MTKNRYPMKYGITSEMKEKYYWFINGLSYSYAVQRKTIIIGGQK